MPELHVQSRSIVGHMKQKQLQARLLEAADRVSICERNIIRQRELIARLESGGQDSGEAWILLREIRETLARLTENHARLRHELEMSVPDQRKISAQ
jgi:alpha-D-ribose 1-methylphosphonate 5-triphosphate synthase subunit PhnI